MPRIDNHKITSIGQKKVRCFKCKRDYFQSELETFKIPGSWGSIRGAIDICNASLECRRYKDWLHMQRFRLL